MTTMKNGALTTTLTEPLIFYLSEPQPPEEPSTDSSPSQSGQLEPAAASVPTQAPLPSSDTSPSQSSERFEAFKFSGPEPSNSSAKPGPGLHPINLVFSDMLQILHAHYLLCVPEESKVTAMQERMIIPIRLAPRRTSVLTAYGRDKKKSRSSNLPDSSRKISPKDRTRLEALAAKLASHEELANLLGNRYEFEDWPATDRVPDKLPKDYDTKAGKKRFADPTWVSQSTVKRSRVSGKPPV
ncbi:hypothetical protein GY45DRAFT_1359949 [Cubamyces sp. BRFM 1775]|nr:hypothetical protein GY45DRAFT_1359949 [Cubamyces sp. BRFM 1775]